MSIAWLIIILQVLTLALILVVVTNGKATKLTFVVAALTVVTLVLNILAVIG